MAKKIKDIIVAGSSFILIGCSSIIHGEVGMEKLINSVGTVERINEETIKVRIFDRPGVSNSNDDILMLIRGDANFFPYLDMVGGGVEVGKVKSIPISFGRVTMLETGDIEVNLVPIHDLRRPGGRYIVEKSSPHYQVLVERFGRIEPGRFRLVMNLDDLVE